MLSGAASGRADSALCASGPIVDADPIIAGPAGIEKPGSKSLTTVDELKARPTSLNSDLVQRFDGTRLAFELTGKYSRISLRVGGPDGYSAIAYSEVWRADNRSCGVRAARRTGPIVSNSRPRLPRQSPPGSVLNNGRAETAPKPQFRTEISRGTFVVVNGAITTMPDISED